jgi:hypothetical protein
MMIKVDDDDDDDGIHNSDGDDLLHYISGNYLLSIALDQIVFERMNE